ncbi:calcineurin-like phosphoesterase [Rhypophila sp. PSN 637]
MTILQALHLRRSSQWDPPTILDHLLTSPLKWIMSILYSYILFLRGRPFHPPPRPPSSSVSGAGVEQEKGPIRVVCLSDTHDQTLAVPDGDLLVHAGDLTQDGSRESIQKQIDWLDGLPHRHKVFVGGNHDGWLDPEARRALLRERKRRQMNGAGNRGNHLWKEEEDEQGKEPLDFKSLKYLENSSVTLDFKGGRRLNVYGYGAVPECGDDTFAFQYKRSHHPWKGAIPEETDVLVTHTPAAHHLDLSQGCPGLLSEIWRTKPKLHIFGHIHWRAGTEPVYFDECQASYESLMSRPCPPSPWYLLGLGPLLNEFFFPICLLSARSRAAWVDALSVLWYGINSILWKWIMQGPRSNNGGLFVNAAVMHGNTGKLRQGGKKKAVVVVVDL